MPVVQPYGKQAVEHSHVGLSHHVHSWVDTLLYHPRQVIHRLSLIHHTREQCLPVAFYSRVWSVACSLRIDVYHDSSILSVTITPYGKAVAPSSLLDNDGIGAPARYQVRGALINLTLSKEASKDISLQGELYAKAETKHEANFNERASLAFHKGIVSIDGYYSLSHGKLFHTTDKTGIHTLANGEKSLLRITGQDRTCAANTPASVP